MKLISKLKNNNFIASVISVGLGNLIGQGLSVITVPILSRIYLVEAYGDYGIVVSTSTIIVSFATLGLMSAIMIPKDDKKSNEIFTAAFWTQLILTTLITLVALFISPIYHFHNVSGSSYTVSLVIMWCYILVTNIKNILYVSINRKGLNKVLLFNPVIGAVGNLLIALPLGLLKFGYEGFFIAGIISEIIMCIQMIRNFNPFIRHFSPNKYKLVIREYRDYVLFQCPANLLETFSSQYAVQYFSRIFNSSILGIYTMCVKLMQYPVTLLAQPISTVYFRTATQYNREGKNLADFTYKMITKILYVAFVPIIIVVIGGEWLFTIILGEKWGPSGTIASILIYQYALYFCAKCVSYCRVSVGRQKTNFLFNISNIVVTALSCWIGYTFTHSLIGTVGVFSIVRCFLQIFDLALNFKCMKKNTVKFIIFVSVYSLIIFSILAVVLLLRG